MKTQRRTCAVMADADCSHWRREPRPAFETDYIFTHLSSRMCRTTFVYSYSTMMLHSALHHRAPCTALLRLAMLQVVRERVGTTQRPPIEHVRTAHTHTTASNGTPAGRGSHLMAFCTSCPNSMQIRPQQPATQPHATTPSCGSTNAHHVNPPDLGLTTREEPRDRQHPNATRAPPQRYFPTHSGHPSPT